MAQKNDSFQLKIKNTGLLYFSVCVLLTIFIVISTAPTCVGETATTEVDKSVGYWLAGFSAFSISPSDEHFEEGLYMGGYGIGKERGAAEGVLDDIRARSMALSDGNSTVIFIVLDITGVSCVDLMTISEKVSHKTGINPDNVIITATHTHSGPDLQGLWGGVPDSYREWLWMQAAKSAETAYTDMEKARLFTGSVDFLEGIVNRRGDDNLSADFQLIHARSLKDKPLGTFTVYGVHTTFIGEENKKISADFSGHFVERLEEKFGGTALFAAGIQGDQVPVKGDLTVEDYADNLTAVALEAFERKKEIPFSSLDYRNQKFVLGVRNPVFILAYIFGYLSDYDVSFSFRNGLNINTELSVTSIGDKLSIVTVPGEILARPAEELKGFIPADNTIVMGLSNGSLGYIVHDDQWNGGIPFLNRGYEESVSMGKHVWKVIKENLQSIVP